MRTQASASRMHRSLALPLALSLLLGSVVTAAGDDSRKNFILSETTAKKLMKVYEFAEDENFQEALNMLEPLTTRSRLKSHDKAVVFQLHGLMLAALNRYAEATRSFEVALAEDALPDATTASLQYNLAQLYMATENYKAAIDMFEKWFASAENPGAQAYFMLSAAYAQTEQWGKALPHARQAVVRSDKPVEQYYTLQLAMEFQNGNLVETLDVLKILVSLFPRKDYYIQLAYGYSQMGEEDKALGMLELAYQQGFLTKGDELVNLTQRYLYANLPFPAARVIQKGMESGLVEKSSKNYELLANSLLYARQYNDAIAPLGKAAELSDDGDLFVRLAQVYLEVEDWKQARKALEDAVSKGGLRDASNVQLLLGISNFNEKRYKSAVAAFEAASKGENTADAARKWLEHVEREQANAEAESNEG